MTRRMSFKLDRFLKKKDMTVSKILNRTSGKKLLYGDTFLVVGLGNYGKQYQYTRHNAGFNVIDCVAESLGIKVRKACLNGLIGECVYDAKRIICVKPQTYMNRSGLCVAPLAARYHIDYSHLIVIYDDIDLKEGQLRVKNSGSAGTHNGMRSVISELDRQDFPRVRVGIGPKPADCEDLAEWVLSPYAPGPEWEAALATYRLAADCVLAIATQGVDEAMKLYNHRTGREQSAR